MCVCDKVAKSAAAAHQARYYHLKIVTACRREAAPGVMSNSSRASGLDRSSSMAFAFFSRRHSSSLGLRRSVSSVSSRRHSSPISQSESLSDSEDNHSTSSSSRFPRSLRWRLLARKVLGNVDEESASAGGENDGEFYVIFTCDCIHLER